MFEMLADAWSKIFRLFGADAVNATQEPTWADFYKEYQDDIPNIDEEPPVEPTGEQLMKRLLAKKRTRATGMDG